MTTTYSETREEAAAGVTAPPDSVTSPNEWWSSYSKRLVISDFVVLVVVVFGTQVLWFGLGNAEVAIRADARISEFSYWLFSAGLVVAWMWALRLIDSRNHRVIGTGTMEYRRVFDASVRLFGFIAICCFLLRIDVARGFLLISLPLGVVTLVLERWFWRRWINRRRRRGEYCARVLLVGSEQSVAHIAHELQRTPEAGYLVVGACVPTGMVADSIPGTNIPIMGSVDTITGALEATGADTVAVTSTDDLPPSKVKEISWSLEAGRQHLVLAPSIVDIAGPRLHTRPVAGLPLIHVETPRFSRGQLFAKRMMDLTLSIGGLIMLSPLLLALAVVVKTSSPGSILFRQTRVGLGGREFTMLKFRTMVANAEELLPSLAVQSRDVGNEVLFKMTNDPRVTRAGRTMRRFSLDELPQLLNVVAGSMSLVGPRPPLPSEVEKYAEHVHRRFLAKPGITGAWQVSGRSTLSWEDSVRLDLSYVENWNVFADVVILLRTVRAVFAPGHTAH
ncbi:sugar transferase [Microbacterium sp. zg.Y909]|uniref:sugar transferase n=1 Tax=Microbacterium sp. zg.Y909 TaxID=2969413 RepID=UPI00214C251A|nr:sugar transferase [Microbacterium sp. zg.Y909]MCR2823947.1 sugar transferase [Microbacterium sp. zg.Y909]